MNQLYSNENKQKKPHKVDSEPPMPGILLSCWGLNSEEER